MVEQATAGAPMIGPLPQPLPLPQPQQTQLAPPSANSYAVLSAKRYAREPYSEVAPPLFSTLAMLVLHANLSPLRERASSLTAANAINSDADSGEFFQCAAHSNLETTCWHIQYSCS